MKQRGSAGLMASCYVVYGHPSIGDCGFTSLHVDDVSLLACKAIEDNAVNSGHEDLC